MKHSEYVLRDDNGDVTSSVNVHVVDLDKDAPRDPDTDRRLPLRVNTTGGDVEVANGVVLVEAGRPGQYDVFDQATFDKLGYEAAESDPVAATPAEESADLPADESDKGTDESGGVPPVLP